MYLTSIICSATIYLKRFPGLSPLQKNPLFLRQHYSITVERESVFKTTPLIKVEAISMNPTNLLPIVYGFVNNIDNEMFVIDTIQGFIYPRYDIGLKPSIYFIQVS